MLLAKCWLRALVHTAFHTKGAVQAICRQPRHVQLAGTY